MNIKKKASLDLSLGVGNTSLYRRHAKLQDIKQVKDKKLRSKLTTQQRLYHVASERLAKSEILLPESIGYLETEGLEKSYSISQELITENISLGAANKRFSLNLSYGPYFVDYTRNGNHLLIGGYEGTIALLDVSNGQPEIVTEIPQLKETIQDVHFLHNYTMFAVAQNKYVYIYDRDGIEIHCIRDHVMNPYKLDFLPYHFLLTSIGEFGELRYQDISTGKVAALHKTGKGACRVMKHNPYNGVIHLGHKDGTVSLWTPNIATPVVKLLAQKGSVTALDVTNHYMVTAGMDNSWKIWDIRKPSDFCPLHNLKSFGASVASISISGTGLVSVGFGCHIQVWKDILASSKPKMPYITHDHNGSYITSIKFQPWNDVLGIGHKEGAESIIVPGAGCPNFDSRVANIFETPKQRRESEVRMLLEKLPESTITLYPDCIGSVDTAPRAVRKVESQTLKDNESKKLKKTKNKKRGRSKIENKIRNKNLRYATMIRTKATEIISEKKLNQANINKDKNKPLDNFKITNLKSRNALDRFR
ncbi:uncharacterized protein CMU_014240 [Cryptosporidium muris RN66]|uniref:BING4 C-terminal domain-containing protein n=1 Tax=Cryptosporidium muris (strain RN66) TaxID=441375 RepID=B6AEY1_CRYMR|nr:uncharacterized protein CMU_014240 [Cryptosporidium muris RN66]EEA06748.1 hypothetical protein, conserved [Cryptosporidium muris RN66]|eukprot:XP_002141097.1 hypothetical protein [Cryptosporidium muris RN66]